MEQPPDEDLETRTRTLTEKGVSYKLEVKGKERRHLLNNLNNLTSSLSDTLKHESNSEVVKSKYTVWLSYYEQLLAAHEDVQKLLDPNTARQDHESFEQQSVDLLTMKRAVEQWFMEHAHSNANSDGKSVQSSVKSDVSSHLSIERIKQDQRKVELLARQEAFKQKRRIEEEKLHLKLKEEELDLQTEINVSDAKSRILEDLEKSILQDNVDIKPQIPELSSIKSNKIEETLSINVARELSKPRAEINKFSGSAFEFTRFKRQFNSRVCNNTDSYDERLNYLLQFTTGEAHKIVTGYSDLRAEIGYKAAFQEFEERYGDADVIAQTYVKKALDWPIIKADDPKALDEFAIFLRECQFAVEDVDAGRVLEYSENLRAIVQKLPYFMHDRWRNVVYELKGKGQTVKFENLVTFVRKEAKKANDPVYGKEMLVSKQTKSSPAKDKQFATTRQTLATIVTDNKEINSNTNQCLFCAEQHNLRDCKNITHLFLTDRYDFLKSKGLCFSCLRAGHRKPDCRIKLTCNICKRLHPTMLHVEPCREAFNSNESNMGMRTNTGQANAARTGAGTALPIVPVRVKAQSSNKFIETYAFLDSGSTATFCSDRVLNLLGVEGKKTILNLTTLGKEQTQVTREIRGLEISSLGGENTIDLPLVFTQPSLPISKADVPSEEDVTGWPHLRDLQLERIDSEVDLLIGVNVPKAMEPWDIIASENGGPFAIKTIFGWVVNGPLEVSGENTESFVKANFIKGSVSLETQIKDYFNADFPERSIDDKPENSREDCQFLESVKDSYKQNDHFFVNLPFKYNCVVMPNNKKQAEQRLLMLSKRFDKDAQFREAYKDFMNKVIEKGYAQRVSPDNKPEDGKVWYLPHHGVFHPKKNKIRVVFDCAARYGGTSLNDQLLQGPNLTNTLLGTLTRFRQEEVAVMGDIESMFYQVRVSPGDRNFQRFLWWPEGDTSAKPIEFQMVVHLFGSTSSPSCANYALRQTAEEARGNFNDEVVDTVLRNMYVDDCLKSAKTEDQAISLVKDLQVLLKRGGFHITMGIIEETLPDRSGVVRQVKVKTLTNKLTRPIDKLCVILEAE